MAFDYERREIRLLQAGSRKIPVSHTLSEHLIKKIDAIAEHNILSRSETIEIALFRFIESYNRKMKKDLADELLHQDSIKPESESEEEFNYEPDGTLVDYEKSLEKE